jgi:hypothetical protein
MCHMTLLSHRKIDTAPSSAIMRLQGSARCRVQNGPTQSDYALPASRHYLKNVSANANGPIADGL